jgi:ribonucleotide monophosphatase NagD (HAD superfamily)
MEYDKLQQYENEHQIAIDFDGVIHRNSKGFHDGTVYDTPVDGSIDAIKWFYQNGYDIVIFTAKVKPDRPLVNGKTGQELVWEWLTKYGIDTYIKEITCEKPRALVYIDDKGMRFETWENTLNLFNEITNK